MSNGLAKEIESLSTIRRLITESQYQSVLAELRRQYGEDAVEKELQKDIVGTSTPRSHYADTSDYAVIGAQVVLKCCSNEAMEPL